MRKHNKRGAIIHERTTTTANSQTTKSKQQPSKMTNTDKANNKPTQTNNKYKQQIQTTNINTNELPLPTPSFHLLPAASIVLPSLEKLTARVVPFIFSDVIHCFVRFDTSTSCPPRPEKTRYWSSGEIQNFSKLLSGQPLVKG